MVYTRTAVPALDGGMVTAVSPAQLDPTYGYSGRIAGMDVSSYGIPRKRPAIVRALPPVEVDGVESVGPLTGIHQYVRTDTSEVRFLAAYAGGVAAWDAEEETWVTVCDALTKSDRTSFLTFANQVAMADGVNPSAVWDGTTLTEPEEFPKAQFLAVYRLRIVAAGCPSEPSKIYLCYPGDPTYWDTTRDGSEAYWAYVSPDDGEGITGVLNVGDGGVLIGKPSCLYGLYGYKTANFVIELIDPSVGVASHWSMIYTRPSAYWVGQDGIYRMEPGSSPEKISIPIQDVFEKDLDYDKLHLAHAVLFNRYYLLTLPRTGGKWITLAYQIDRQRWGIWYDPDRDADGPRLGSTTRVITTPTSPVYFSDPVTEGYIGSFEYEKFADNDTAPVVAWVETVDLDGGDPLVEKDIKDVFIVFKAAADPYHVNVYFNGDCRGWVLMARNEVISGAEGSQVVLRVVVGKCARFFRIAVESTKAEPVFPLSLYYFHSARGMV